MFDSISLWLPQSAVTDIDLFAEVPTRLTNVRGTTLEGSITNYSGHLKNLRINASTSGIRIQGSLSSFLHGNNHDYITLEELDFAFFYIGRLLKIPIEKSIVRMIDFGVDVEVIKPPRLYIGQFYDSTNYTGILMYPNSITFSTDNRKKILYDKTKKSKSGNVLATEPYRIRFEQRYKNARLKQLFAELTVEKLLTVATLSKLLTCLLEEFMSMKKHETVALKTSEVETPRDFTYQLAALTIEYLGEERVLSLVDELALNGSFKTCEYPSRSRAIIKKIINRFSNSDENQYYQELANKTILEIENIKEQLPMYFK